MLYVNSHAAATNSYSCPESDADQQPNNGVAVKAITCRPEGRYTMTAIPNAIATR
jgi:hypothetical protein